MSSYSASVLHMRERCAYYNLEDQAEPLQVWQTFQDYLESRIEEAIGA